MSKYQLPKSSEKKETILCLKRNKLEFGYSWNAFTHVINRPRILGLSNVVILHSFKGRYNLDKWNTRQRSNYRKLILWRGVTAIYLKKSQPIRISQLRFSFRKFYEQSRDDINFWKSITVICILLFYNNHCVNAHVNTVFDWEIETIAIFTSQSTNFFAFRNSPKFTQTTPWSCS